MLDELLLGLIATVSLVVLFKTRQYLNRLEEVAEEIVLLRAELKKGRKQYKKRKRKPKEDEYAR